MALSRKKSAAAIAAMVATSMVAMPASAVELPQIASSAPATAYDGDIENANGWRGRRHRRGGVDAGDVIAGVVVLGAIAAIASSASNSRRDRDRDRYEERNVRYREPARQQQRSWGSGGIDSAVDMCVDQVERGSDRVESVDNASRDASGWNVAGSMSSGDYFTCRIDNDGRIRSIDMGDDFSAYQAPAGAAETVPQWSDEDYARARASVRSGAQQGGSDSVDADLMDGPLPAYPGGPLPGEEGYEESLSG